MPFETKYTNQEWGEDSPIPGERLSTNGYYTGEHRGTVLQDAAVEGMEQPHQVEENTIRFGTIMPDAISGSMPNLKEGDS